MSREQANDLVLKLLSKYEANAADAPLGKEYQECYDAATALPIPEHFDMYRRIKDELAEMGWLKWVLNFHIDKLCLTTKVKS
jgi:methylamine--corrinoid protein Co-methyltransferase